MKKLYVKQQYRTNQLSKEPGGYEVTVTYASGFSKVYDRVKYPKKFISKINEDANRGDGHKIKSIKVSDYRGE
jgi:hypothetical protein